MMNSIDVSKLKRNYELNPIKRKNKQYIGDIPYREDMEYLYITLNITAKQLALYFNVSESTVLHWLKKYEIRKPLALRTENTLKAFQEKYSGRSSFCDPKVREKSKKTCQEKWGVDNPGQAKEIKEKKKVTMREKYGVDYPMQSEQIMNTLIKNNNEKYGVDYVSQRPNHYKNSKNKLGK